MKIEMTTFVRGDVSYVKLHVPGGRTSVVKLALSRCFNFKFGGKSYTVWCEKDTAHVQGERHCALNLKVGREYLVDLDEWVAMTELDMSKILSVVGVNF